MLGLQSLFPYLTISSWSEELKYSIIGRNLAVELTVISGKSWPELKPDNWQEMKDGIVLSS